MSTVRIHRNTFFILFILIFFINKAVFSQDLGMSIKKINYAILSGQESVSDSLLKKISTEEIDPKDKIQFETLLKCLYGLHYAYFHYDYLLDSLQQSLENNNIDGSYLAHILKLIKAEQKFNKADWWETSILSLEFADEEMDLDDNVHSPLFYAISLSNIIISRDNLLLSIDSILAKNFELSLDLIFKNSVDSLNKNFLIKFYWASSILNLDYRKKLKEILWGKLLTLPIEDLAYFESILSTYSLDNHTFYEQRNNPSIYDGITEQIIKSNKSYFVRDKWFQHIRNFGLFGDNKNEKSYFDIEVKYINGQENISPYFLGQRIIQYGIYYGNKNRAMSSSYFSRFYDLFSTDSTFQSQNYRFLNYVAFEDLLYNGNPNNRFLTKYVEDNKLISKKNSKQINYLYTMTYVNQLALTNEFAKIDSLLKIDTIANEFKSDIISNKNYKFLKATQLMKDSFSLKNYISLKASVTDYLRMGELELIHPVFPDLIEYAAYYSDIPFADSLLNEFGKIILSGLKEFDQGRLQKTDLGMLLKNYYIERSYVTLFNRTGNKTYLLKLVEFKLLKDKAIQKIVYNKNSSSTIDSVQREILYDEIIKSFKYTTNTFEFEKDYNYFEK